MDDDFDPTDDILNDDDLMDSMNVNLFLLIKLDIAIGFSLCIFMRYLNDEERINQ